MLSLEKSVYTSPLEYVFTDFSRGAKEGGGLFWKNNSLIPLQSWFSTAFDVAVTETHVAGMRMRTVTTSKEPGDKSHDWCWNLLVRVTYCCYSRTEQDGVLREM